ncbi:hypothetical protein PSP6_270136 [Paraburkholderia tropica]|nr:hypothetical protein PSP6_270136 [Paraburkholderia tropica]
MVRRKSGIKSGFVGTENAIPEISPGFVHVAFTNPGLIPEFAWQPQANSGQISGIAESSLSRPLQSQVAESARDEVIFWVCAFAFCPYSWNTCCVPDAST